MPAEAGFGQYLIDAAYYLIMTLALPRVSVYSTAQIADYPPGSTFGPRGVPDYELIWLLRGAATWSHRDPDPFGSLGEEHQLTLRPGQLALARRGSRDVFAWHETRPSRHGYVHFALLDGAPLGPEADWPDLVPMAGFPVLEGLCGYLLELSGRAGDEALDRSDHVVSLILDVAVNGPRPAAPGGPDAWPDGLRAMVDVVRRDWQTGGMRPIGIAELATAAHLSAGHLHRLFRERFGCGPAHALELVRLTRAAILLQRSNSTLAAVARATGFANAYHFSRRFSAAFGTPPGAFRHQAESGQPSDPLGPVRASRLSGVAQRLL